MKDSAVPPRLRPGMLAAERREFVERHREVLVRFWTDHIQVCVADGTIAPGRLITASDYDTDEDVALRIAERILERISTVERLDHPPDWTDVESWWTWTIGGRARKSEMYYLRLPTGGAHDAADDAADTTAPDRVSWEEDRRIMMSFVAAWASILEEVVAATGVRALEAYWLWATIVARRPLIQAVREILVRDGGEVPSESAMMEDDRKTLTDCTPSPGRAAADRTRRSRAGAVAAFRFNLAAFRRVRRGGKKDALRFLPERADPEGRGIDSASDAFLGPAEQCFPYRPASPDRNCATAFEAGLRVMVRAASEPAREWTRPWVWVIACGINRESARLLPRALEDAVRARWTTLVGPDGEGVVRCE